jgi:hypothetical protein
MSTNTNDETTPAAMTPLERASLEHRRRPGGPLTLDVRSALVKLHAGELRCHDCRQPAVSVRTIAGVITPMCKLCGEVRAQRRQVDIMRATRTQR